MVRRKRICLFDELTTIRYIFLDFSILAPYGRERQMTLVSHMLAAANENEKVEILQHPLLGRFI